MDPLAEEGLSAPRVCPGWIITEFQQTAQHDEYIRYVDRWYGPREVAEQAMDIWCRQQGIE